MSEPGTGPRVTSTRVSAARRISPIRPADSSGLTGLAMPAACAPNSVKKACGTRGSKKLTTSLGPTPKSANRLAACVTRPMNCACVIVTGGSSGSALDRNWMAGACGLMAAPICKAS